MEAMHSDSLDDSLTSIQWLCQLESKKILEDDMSAIADRKNAIRAQAVTQQQRQQKQDDMHKNPYPKPHYSYATLIVFAINSSREKRMTLQEIYAWIEENYPFYKSAKKGWKNSIRHNLSLHKFFVKEKRPSMLHGKGSYWRISPEGKENLMRDLMKQSQNLRPPTALLPHDPNRKLRPIMPKPTNELESSKVHYVPFLACNLPIVFVPSTSMSAAESCAEADTRWAPVFSSPERQTGVVSFVQAKAGSSGRSKPINVSCESSTCCVMSHGDPTMSHSGPTISPGDPRASRGWTLKVESASHGTTTVCHGHTQTSSASSRSHCVPAAGPVVSPGDPKVPRYNPTVSHGDPTLSRRKVLKRKSSTNAHHGQGLASSPSWNVKKRNGDNHVSSSRKTATKSPSNSKQLPNILRRKRKTRASFPATMVRTPPKSMVQSTLAAINSTVQVAAYSPKFGYDDIVSSMAELTSSPLGHNAFDFGSPGFSPLRSPLRFGGHVGFTPPSGFTPVKQEADSGIVTPVKGFGDLSFNWTPFKTGLTPLIQSPPKNELASCSDSQGCRKSLGLDKVNEISDECGRAGGSW